MGYPQLAVMNISHRYFDLEEFFSSAAASGYTCCELWTGAMHLYVDCHGYDSLEQVRDDNLISIYWLYNHTGDAFLLELAEKIHRNTEIGRASCRERV